MNQAPKAAQQMLEAIWVKYLKQASDQSGDDGGFSQIRRAFFSSPWNEVYDFVEFVLENAGPKFAVLAKRYNEVMEEENAGYRVVGKQITPITNAAELESIESAYQSGLPGVNIHIKRAIELLSDRKSPDYRNAIKEAVSAVESACRVVSSDEKATLGQALKKLGEKSRIHPAMEKALPSLYGYTSDQGGIRHSLLEESSITFTDAKFMVVACSAFINYVAGKMSEAIR